MPPPTARRTTGAETKRGWPWTSRVIRHIAAAAANRAAVSAGEEWPLRLPSFMTKFMATKPATAKPRKSQPMASPSFLDRSQGPAAGLQESPLDASLEREDLVE